MSSMNGSKIEATGLIVYRILELKKRFSALGIPLLKFLPILQKNIFMDSAILLLSQICFLSISNNVILDMIAFHTPLISPLGRAHSLSVLFIVGNSIKLSMINGIHLSYDNLMLISKFRQSTGLLRAE